MNVDTDKFITREIKKLKMEKKGGTWYKKVAKDMKINPVNAEDAEKKVKSKVIAGVVEAGNDNINDMIKNAQSGKGTEKWQIQAVLFKKALWTKDKAMKFLKEHDFKPIKKVHETRTLYRYRIKEPIKGYFYRTKELKNGVQLVMMSGSIEEDDEQKELEYQKEDIIRKVHEKLFPQNGGSLSCAYGQDIIYNLL